MQESSGSAIAVGYESVSQFSQEFKHYFGNAPIEARLDAYSQAELLKRLKKLGSYLLTGAG